MTASSAPRTAPLRLRDSPFDSWSFLGILLMALVLLLHTSPGKSCPPVDSPENGRVLYVNGYTSQGSQAYFLCNEGYTLVGRKNIICDRIGNKFEWSGSPPRCEKRSCQPPGTILNGKYTNSHKDVFEYNEVVTYSCNPSQGPDEYSLVGEPKLICTGNDKWSSNPPECKVVKCQSPVVQNGKQVSGFGEKYYYNAVVQFECDQGFQLKGNNTIVCGADSMWKPEMPQCVKVSTSPSTKPMISSVSETLTPSEESQPNDVEDLGGCDDPPRFESMMLSSPHKNLYVPGDKIEYQCRLGYEPILPSVTTTTVCQTDSTWTPLQEACTRKSCPQLEEPLNGQIIYVNETFQFGSQAHYVCNDGFHLRGTEILHCELSGSNVDWSDNPPECERKSCPQLEEPLNGQINYVNGTFQFGSQAHYVCNDGFHLRGTKILHCELSGSNVDWSDNPPECERKSCPQLEEPLNGQIIYVNGTFQFGSQAHYVCNEGFHLRGTKILHCELSGSNVNWSDNPPECERKSCPQLEEPLNGQIIYVNGTFQFGSQAHYVCNEGFHLRGTKILHCELSGSNVDWSDNPPECEKTLIPSEESQPNDVEDLGGCDDPPRFESMMLSSLHKNLYVPGDKIEYQCRLGYEPILPSVTTTAVCQPDSTWTPLQEACTRKSCPQLEEPLNGQIIYVNGTFQFGSLAHYVCNEGFRLRGTKILHCERSGSNVDWSDNPPECEIIICQDPVVENGRLVSGFGRKYYYGVEVGFECDKGFHLQGNSTISCGANSAWEPEMPQCIKETEENVTSSDESQPNDVKDLVVRVAVAGTYVY